MNKRSISGSIMMLVGAFIWGVSFVAQSEGMNYIEPFTFNGIRSIMASIALFCVVPILKFITPELMKEEYTDKKVYHTSMLKTGIICGILLFCASSLQQIGISMTTAGKSGFITAFYIVLVPVCGIFLKKKIGVPVWIAVVLGILGMYMLSVTPGEEINKGDLITLCCAGFYTGHILYLEKVSPSFNGVKLSCIQFAVAGLLSLPFMFILETPNVAAIFDAAIPLLYAGIMSGAVAFTLQIIAQQRMPATLATLIMSLESVFAGLSGWVLLNERLNAKELTGCVMIFAAVLLAQFPIDVWIKEKIIKRKQ